jgi:hypothetical protein
LEGANPKMIEEIKEKYQGTKKEFLIDHFKIETRLNKGFVTFLENGRELIAFYNYDKAKQWLEGFFLEQLEKRYQSQELSL